MKKTLLALATSITLSAAGTSFYLTTLPNPTDAQMQLSTACNTISVAGASAIFTLVKDDDNDDDSNVTGTPPH
ncbi:hypothetical protein NIES2100_10080 [Calothrix sp. NIES-2100]|uniref:hypothetical protein n=1 Tax=Calothrix sp. NIES-2100 TaxID=1954172 RepID=UPI000B61878C|nr:hypothetical protein NIES2100_10080 [Calothrix sp. NIES-2100]